MRGIMRLIAGLAAVLSLLGLGFNLGGVSAAVPHYVAVAGLIVAGLLSISGHMGPFLRFFSIFYGVSFSVLMALMLLKGAMPAALAGLVPPALTAFTAAAFVAIPYLLSRIPVIRSVATIADPYFETKDRRSLRIPGVMSLTAPERWIGMGLLAVIMLINLGQVALSVRLNFWNREWFDSIQNKNEPEFWRLLVMVWAPLVAVWIVSNIFEYVLESVFKVRWRTWMTERLTARWLDRGTHYRLNLFGNGVDNPDQRIQEDIRKYIETTYSLSITLISQISRLISFSVILWGLSEVLTLPGSETKIPGLLLWLAIVYAAVGTLVTHFIGRRLIPLFFLQERYEANFRFGLARLREFSEPIALLNGEPTEQKRLSGLFGQYVENFYRIVHVRKWLNAFVSFYGMLNSVAPYVIVAPFYFAGKVTLGAMTQTASAFASVDAALSFFIDRYAQLADYKAVVDRLNGFDEIIDKALAAAATSRIDRTDGPSRDLVLPDLDLTLPSGADLASVRGLSLRSGARTLITGPSGSGKSTLFRAIAGIWPFGRGRVELPKATIMVLPQRPYLPMGTLRSAVSYPLAEGVYSDEALRTALDEVRLPHLKSRLDEEAHWTQVLSGGEQQRLAIARALLAKPDWLLMDESTSALDEPLEAEMYGDLRRLLPETTVVSVGHRSSLIAFHDQRIEMKKGEDGKFRPVAL
jgi:putative ATP-binding cassette transporter